MAVPLSRANRIKCSDNERPVAGNIAAIDFGTTSLTLSYVTTGDKDISTIKFGSENDARIPNAILLERSKDGKYIATAIGNTARTNFSRVRGEKRMTYIYFERIKMLLKRDKGFDRQAHVTSFTGESFYLIEVIAFILKYLALELQSHLSSTVKPLKKSDFDWVITVPAIWDAKGKRLMRESAFLSGILTDKDGITSLTPVGSGIPPPTEINTEKLTLALEPECAAIYSQFTSKNQADQIKKAVGKVEAKEVEEKISKGYLVIDAGGGTIDITAQVEVKGGIEVVTVPTGNVQGGTQVNEKFSLKFQEIVGDKGFSKFLACDSDTAATSRKVVCDNFLYTEFESQKVSFAKGDLLNGELSIAVPKEILSFYGAETIRNGIKSLDGYDFEDDSDTIYITADAAEETLFSDSISAIIDSTKAALESLKKGLIGTVYLVGGFGSSKLVRDYVIKALESYYNVVVPPSPLLAIATGAVMWRKDKEIIKARRSDATYGIAIQDTFDGKMHDPAYKVHNDIDCIDYCRDILEVIVLKGEQVSRNEEFESNLRAPPSNGPQIVPLVLYTTKDDDVQYVNAPDGKPLARPIGQLLVTIPKLPDSKRQIKVITNFSGTEIQAKATYFVSENRVETVTTVCDFLSATSHI